MNIERDLTPHMLAVRKAAGIYGSKKKMAEDCGIAYSLVMDATLGIRRLGPISCLKIVRQLGGAVKIREFLPEVDWDAVNL